MAAITPNCVSASTSPLANVAKDPTVVAVVRKHGASTQRAVASSAVALSLNRGRVSR
jgi:hypothetical protein